MALVTDPGVTQRLPATSLLTVDSEDRFKDITTRRGAVGSKATSPYNFSIYATGTVLGGFIRRIGVSEIVFPWTIPNVNRISNTMIINWSPDGGVTVNTDFITLPVGFYNPSELASAVQAAIRLIDPTLNAFTISYGTDKLPRFDYATNAAGVEIGFEPVDSTSTGFWYGPDKKQLIDLLGFTDGNYALDVDGVGKFTFCQYSRYVDIVCPQLVQYQGLADGTTQQVKYDSLCRVYLKDATNMMNLDIDDVEFNPPGTRPFIIYTNFNNMKNISWNANSNIGNTLDFRVYDETGTLLSDVFASNADPTLYADWSMTMLASEN